MPTLHWVGRVGLDPSVPYHQGEGTKKQAAGIDPLSPTGLCRDDMPAKSILSFYDYHFMTKYISLRQNNQK
jgi:hypothetical protein